MRAGVAGGRDVAPLCIRGFASGDMNLIDVNQFSLVGGDEPAHASSTVTRWSFSLRERGWARAVQGLPARREVFPACVGVSRS